MQAIPVKIYKGYIKKLAAVTPTTTAGVNLMDSSNRQLNYTMKYGILSICLKRLLLAL